MISLIDPVWKEILIGFLRLPEVEMLIVCVVVLSIVATQNSLRARREKKELAGNDRSHVHG